MRMRTHDPNITFRAAREQIDRLDELIIQAKARGDLDRDVTRSDLLRERVDHKIAELESQLDE